jgi:glutamate-1-semialdehyde 2,1-aminomutase
MQGASGSIAGTDEFLQVLREACSSSGVLLIFDEVMTSRLGPNGRQGQIDVIPDITTLGKYVGGGISFGAFGGSAEIMDRYDPSVPSSFVHHGTFNNNVFMLMAGAAGLEKILTLDAQNSLNSSGDDLRITLNSVAQRHHASFQTSGLGSIMTMHFQSKPIKSIRDIESRDPRLRQLLHLDLIDKGFFTTRRGFMALSLAITDQNRNDFITAINEFLSQYGMLLESSP